MSTSKWVKNQWEEGQAAEEKETLSSSHYQTDSCEALAPLAAGRLGALAHLAVSW